MMTPGLGVVGGFGWITDKRLRAPRRLVSFSSGLYQEAGLKIADGSGYGLLSINRDRGCTTAIFSTGGAVHADGGLLPG